MTFHRDLTLDDVHTCSARDYADLTARDADTDFHAAKSVNKMVRVNSPEVRFYVLASIGPPVWVEVSNTTSNSFLEMLDTPSSYTGAAGKSVQVNVAANALELGQKLRTSDSPSFENLTLAGGLNISGAVTLSDSLTVEGDLIINGDSVDLCVSSFTTEAKKIDLSNIGTPTDIAADGGGIVLIGTTNKSILWFDSTDAWTFNQNVVISGDLTVQGATTTIDSTTLSVDDKNIELGTVTTPTDITADGGGITLKGTTDKTITWLNSSNAWTFNQDIDALANIIKTTGVITGGIMIATTQSFAGNLLLSGNTLSSTNANGNITLTPNGTGKVVIDNISLIGNTIETSSGDLDVISGTGGVFKFTASGIRAGLDAVEYVEVGHGGTNGFINAVGDGGLDFRFEGATLATFTDFGHLHLMTNVDQKHTLKIITNNNLNDTGIAWENSGGSFTHTIFRTDVGVNRADLIFAAGLNTNIDLLTNSFKIHGASGVEGKLEVLGTLQISSGSPALDRVLTSDANGLATWQTLPAGLGGWIDDGTVVRLNNVGDNVGIGTAAPGNQKLAVQGTSFAATGDGSELIKFRDNRTTTGSAPNYVLAINRQNSTTAAWYLGNDGNTDAIFATNNRVLRIGKDLSGTFTELMRIETDGKVGIGTTSPNATLEVNGTPGASVGGFPSGTLHVTSPATSEFSNSVITGHSSFNTNTQLWYLGSASSSNDDITLINRQNAKLFLSTNNVNRITILAGGNVGVNEGNPIEKFDVNGNVKCVTVIDKTIFAQLNSSVDQVPGDTNPTVITYNTQDAINGLTHSTTVNPGEITIDTAGIYFVSPQPQVGKDSGAAKTDFDMFLQVDTGSGFADEANSNIKLTIKDSDITDVIVSAFTISLVVGDKIRMMQRVSSSTVGLGLKNTDAEVGPPTIPRTPAIIFTMYRVGGIAA